MSDFTPLDIEGVIPEDVPLAETLRALLDVGNLETESSQVVLAVGDGGALVQSLASTLVVSKFAEGITPVEIVATLPVSGNYVGRTVVLTTDKKLYRHDGSIWTAAVASADISGQLSDSQIAAIAAAKITGQVVAAQIANAAITTAKFAAGITPVEIVSSLPGSGNFDGRQAYNTTDKKLYRHNGTAWTAATAAGDVSGQLSDSQIAAIAAAKITGQLVAAQIADAAINTAKFASGIRPIEIVATLPTTGNLEGRMVYLTSDDKVYRHNGTSFISTTAAADVTGTLSDAQIAAVAAAKLTGQIVATQITDGAISTPKLSAGAVNAAAIAAGAIIAGKIAAGVITGTEIAASTITGSHIATDTIVAGNIAAGAIGASEIAANAIVAGKIAAGTIVATDIAAAAITGANIAADTITAGNIATGAITADEIAAATITGAKIAAATISASNIAADTITAGQIAAGAIGASEIAAGAVVAGKIAAGTTVAADIAAATITGAKLAAGTITAGNIAAGTITASEIAAAAITGAKIAAGTITAANLAADTITAGQIAAGAIGASEIAANSISADKMEIGQRAVDVGGLEFSISGNTLSWLAGTIEYVNDAGANALAAITANSAAWTTGKLYVYWAKGATVLSTTTSYATAKTGNNVILAIYEGGDNLTVNLGRTIISGAKIRTGSISATQLAANSVTATQIAAGAVTAAKIAADAITADKIDVTDLAAVSGTLGNVDISNANIGSLTVGSFNLQAGAVIPSKAYRGATNNRIRDFEMLEKGMLTFMHYTKASGSGTKSAVASGNISRLVNDPVAYMGNSDYKYQINAASLTDCIEVETDNLSPVSERSPYMINGSFWNINGASFDQNQAMLTVQWWTINSSGVPIRLSTDFGVGALVANTGARVTVEFESIAPPDASFASLIWSTIPTNTNAVLPHIQVASPVIRELPQRLESSWIGKQSSGTTTWAAATGRAIAVFEFALASAQFPIKRTPTLAIVTARFRNAGAGGQTYEVQLREWDPFTSTVGTQILDSIPVHNMGANVTSCFTLFDDFALLGYVPDAYAIFLVASQGGNDIRSAVTIVDLRYS